MGGRVTSGVLGSPGPPEPISVFGRFATGGTIRVSRRRAPLGDSKLRRVPMIWALLFFDILGAGQTPLVPLPHRVGQLLTQGALWLALALALSINPRVRVRGSIFLGLYTLLGITSLMSSIRLVSVGTDYRAVRLLGFVAVLWLLSPWWGRKDLVILRSHIKFLIGIIASVLLGIVVSPGSAFGGGGRLQDAWWPIPPTQVAHYSAELSGLALVLWMSGLLRGRPAALLGVSSFVVLLLTHTRTALAGTILGAALAGASLFTSRRRVRRTFTACVLVVALVGVPLAPLIVAFVTRGQSAAQIASLTGRTNFWGYVFAASARRPLTNEILGNGLSNGSIYDPYQPSVQGLPIDSSWVEDYQDQGIIGDFLVAIMFTVLLLAALLRPRGPGRAVALFLIAYCLVASFTEDGAGIASQYTLDLTVAASLLVPTVGNVRMAKGYATVEVDGPRPRATV